jgi:hypothetical protein
MSNETRSTLLDPITPQNAVLLLIDQQEGLLARVYEPEQMRGHLLGLARGAQLLGVPVVMTTALSAGTNGVRHEVACVAVKAPERRILPGVLLPVPNPR